MTKKAGPALTPEELGEFDLVFASHEHIDNLDVSGRGFLTDLCVHVEPAMLHDLWWGIKSCEIARRRGDIGFTGAESYGDEFSAWFAAPTALTDQ